MKKRIIIVSTAVLCLAAIASGVFFLSRNKWKTGATVYQTICERQYCGTEEELLASLAGETVSTDKSETAYALAVKKGYNGSFGDWMKTLTGFDTADEGMPAYSLAVQNGYKGTLSEWLTSLSDNSEKLGKASENGQKTEYELACAFGFSGSYAEWLVSLINK